MTRHDALTVRRSNRQPDKYVICSRDTGTAMEHPRARLCQDDRPRVLAESYFDCPTDAQLAIDDWRELAQELPTNRVPLKGLAVARVVTLADELKKLQQEQAKRDANPFHGWHPCPCNADCMCIPAPAPFRSPSKELLAYQAGKKAY